MPADPQLRSGGFPREPAAGALDAPGIYLQLLARWVQIAAGRTYFHVPQGSGPHFDPVRLAGYFIDLRAKTRWSGPVDPQGLPLNRGRGNALVHFPTTLFHKGLGHWDAWLASGRRDATGIASMLRIVDWACEHQDAAGGWPWPPALQWPGATCPYSAMSQGEGASLLCRAYVVRGDEALVSAAVRAIELALTPVERGGTAQWSADGLRLEEYPRARARTVLNGWIYALMGIHDVLLVREQPYFRDCLERTVQTLVRELPDFDARYWSLYDSGGEIASPSYHERHIVQLCALEATFANHASAIAPVRRRFERQRASRMSRMRAIGTKVLGKLRSPPEFVLR
jgi:heparosan-N-sulfate-glucuronate 5-epimerase